jgi:hypothetical protein
MTLEMRNEKTILFLAVVLTINTLTGYMGMAGQIQRLPPLFINISMVSGFQYTAFRDILKSGGGMRPECHQPRIVSVAGFPSSE